MLHFSSKFSAIYCQLGKFHGKVNDGEQSGIGPQAGHSRSKRECEFKNQFHPIVRSQSWSNCKHRMKIWWWWNAYFSQAFRTWWFLLLIAYYRDRLIYLVLLFLNFGLIIFEKKYFPDQTRPDQNWRFGFCFNFLYWRKMSSVLPTGSPNS